MNERIEEFRKQCDMYDREFGTSWFDHKKFAELLINECIKVAKQQHDPHILNYKPSERFVEDLRQHFGVAE